MDIDIAQAAPHELAVFNEPQDLFISGFLGHGQSLKKREDFFPVIDLTASQLTDYERMGGYLATAKQVFEVGMAGF
jgi:hypothetical protein